MSTLTVYPAPGVTVDGIIKRDVTTETWATIRDNADGNEVDYSGAIYASARIAASSTTNQWSVITRSILLFDTSALTGDATISATVLSLYGFGKNDGLSATPTIDIYTSTPASNTVLANGDYDQIGTTSQTGSPVTYAGWAAGVYNAFTFDATGIGNVSKTSISKFGVRNANYDVANTPPSWSSGAGFFFQYYSSNESGTSKDPKLVVTYSTVVGPANLKTYNTNVSANIKTINTNPIANVKTLNTNA